MDDVPLEQREVAELLERLRVQLDADPEGQPTSAFRMSARRELLAVIASGQVRRRANWWFVGKPQLVLSATAVLTCVAWLIVSTPGRTTVAAAVDRASSAIHHVFLGGFMQARPTPTEGPILQPTATPVLNGQGVKGRAREPQRNPTPERSVAVPSEQASEVHTSSARETQTDTGKSSELPFGRGSPRSDEHRRLRILPTATATPETSGGNERRKGEHQQRKGETLSGAATQRAADGENHRGEVTAPMVATPTALPSTARMMQESQPNRDQHSLQRHDKYGQQERQHSKSGDRGGG